LLVSVFKRYIHVERLLSRSTDQLIAAYSASNYNSIAAYSASNRWFQARGHHPELQILDNEAPKHRLPTGSPVQQAQQQSRTRYSDV
jgi:hypothetical protein